ncbi:MAG: hypothetical protein ACYC7D_15270 [Nitrososphaerales archaeon]
MRKSKAILAVGCLLLLSIPLISLLSADMNVESYSVSYSASATFPFYNAGLDSMFNTLLKPSPCGSGQTAVSEAPSVPYNWWTDDNAKVLGALAYAYPYDSQQASEILSFLQHNIVNGYALQKCQQIVPEILNSSATNMTAWNKLWFVKGNPTLGLQNPKELFSVIDNENPTLAQAYIESQTASFNNITIALDTGVANVVNNGGFDSGLLSPWTGSVTIGSTYHRSGAHSAVLGTDQSLNQVLPQSLQEPVPSFNNLTWWATTNESTSEVYSATILYADGTNATFSEIASPSSAPGTFSEGIIQRSELSSEKTISGIEFSTQSTSKNVMLDDISMQVKLSSPTFNVSIDSNGNVVMQESNVIQHTVNIRLCYILEPNRPYILVNTSITNDGSTPLKDPTIYNAFDGLDTINSGYAWLYFPGSGWQRADQNLSTITENYMPSAWNQNWFAIGMHYIPDWIGSDAIFVVLNQSNLPQGNGAFRVNQVTNTLFQNSSFTGNGNYLHWLQMSFNAKQINSSSTASYEMKYVFVPSYDWTNVPLYSNFFNGSNIDKWNNTYFASNYYYGEIANDLAIYAKVSGSSLSFNLASQVWNYYYRMIQAENNGTYTASLARFVNASSTLYEMTGNQTYLSGLKYGANLLETMQQSSSSSPNTTAFYFHYDSLAPSINGVNSFGALFNSSANVGVGKVYSGQTVSLNFFEYPPNANAYQETLNGTLKTIFYMNSNAPGTGGLYNTTLQYIAPNSSTYTIAASPTEKIALPSGSGAPSFAPFESDISVPNVTLPAGSALEIHLKVSVPSGIVYVLVDSTNGPSRTSIPFLRASQPWVGTFEILSPSETASNAAPQQQPYFLDLTAISGSALYTAYQVTGNVTYLQRAILALHSIHWGDAPSGTKILGLGYSNIPSEMRLYSYANSTYIDTDYSTYKAVLVADFAIGLNDTLANIAMSRVWDRTVVNSSFVQINTGESSSLHIEMNSETQPWGLEAWLQYELYWGSRSAPGTFPLYIHFANEQDVVVSLNQSGTQSASWTVNGTGHDSFYDGLNSSSYNLNVSYNGANVSNLASSASGGFPASSYFAWQSQISQMGNFTLKISPRSYSNSTLTTITNNSISSSYQGAQTTTSVSKTATSSTRTYSRGVTTYIPFVVLIIVVVIIGIIAMYLRRNKKKENDKN